jgi:tRNA/rRNA methyltransferase
VSAEASALDAARVRFILVESQSAGNIGASARALKNLGFSRLALVRPQCDHSGSEARKMAVDARDLLGAVTLHGDLDGALAGAGVVVGTSRRMGKHRRPHWRFDELSDELARSTLDGELAVVFGREDHGLSDLELDRCTHLAHLPAASAYPSFNLSQAVLLCAYELRMAGLEVAPEPALVAPADHALREAMYCHLERALRTIGFLTTDSGEVVMRHFRRLLGRAQMTPEEVKMLRGVARQILWAAERAGLEIADEPDS